MTSAREWVEKIHALELTERVKVMNVCGGHERSVTVSGMRSAMPEHVEIIPGPGCPVCICPEEDVYEAIQLALNEKVVLVAFGDMLRVPVNVKKGQFLAPWDIANVAEKIISAGNRRILITERGTMFGYNNLVVDFRSFMIMRKIGYPVIFDATHSVQLPGGAGSSSGGQRECAPMLARAAAAAGVDGIFMEVHRNPDKALCDGPNSLKLDTIYELLSQLKSIHTIANG